jgi:hypothetical protein
MTRTLSSPTADRAVSSRPDSAPQPDLSRGPRICSPDRPGGARIKHDPETLLTVLETAMMSGSAWALGFQGVSAVESLIEQLSSSSEVGIGGCISSGSSTLDR